MARVGPIYHALLEPFLLYDPGLPETSGALHIYDVASTAKVEHYLG